MKKRFLRTCIVLFLGVAPCASADVASEAGFFDALGRKAYAAGRYQEALDAFQLAQEIAPSSRMLYNIALCADLSGRPEMAFSLFREYLQGTDPDAARRVGAERRVGKLQSRFALVEVVSDPPGAIVYVDRKELGRFGVTPAVVPVPEGERRLILERAGYASASASAVAARGSLARVNVPLVPLLGTVRATVTPRTARLTLERDGTTVEAIPSEGRYRLPIGRYRFRATAPGFLTADAEVAVYEEREAPVELVLLPAMRDTGRLLVKSGTAGAEVFVDGKRVAVTPATLHDVEVGEHEVEVRAGGRSARRTVHVVKSRASYVEAVIP